MLDEDLKNLLILSQKGDKTAYRTFLDLVGVYISSTLRRKIGINDYNDDIAQEVLLAVHKNLNTYNPSSPLKPWLLGIVKFKVADYFRKVGKDLEKLTLADEETLQEEQQAPEEKFGNKLFIQDFLKDLSGCTKKAIILTKVEGRSIREASEILGVKEVNLRKQLSRAMKQLVQRFEFYE